MARTDKTDPFWVQSQHDPHATIRHGWACEHRTRNQWNTSIPQPCDLPEVGAPGNRHTECRRWSHDVWWRLYKGANAWDTHTFYYGPERARTRTELISARRDYNTYGETDVDVSIDQHRHTPWGGGWWD